MIRVGIPVVIRGDAWLGGKNYFLSLLGALDKFAPDHYRFFCLTNRSDLFPKSYTKKIQVVQCDHLTASSPRISKLCKYFQTDIRIAYYARKFKLTVLTHTSPGVRLTPPAMYWMPDFQHCHLPHLFSEDELRNRNRLIAMAAERSGHLLLSSHSAAQDFKCFFPEYKQTKTHVVQFSPNITLADFDIARRTLESAKKQSLADRGYFYLPNQFWIHKNHKVVLEALKKVSSDIKVVATGYTSDHRNASHFSELQSFIEEYNLQDKFVVLGLVSRDEVMSLMAGAIAVINPSFFEGWSTTVEEAKVFGKRMILSNIPVHREQCGARAHYFEPNDANTLGVLLEQMYEAKGEILEHSINDSASYRNLELSQKRFADGYLNALEHLYDDTLLGSKDNDK